MLHQLDDAEFDVVDWVNGHLDDLMPAQGSAKNATLQSLETALSALLTQVSLARTDVDADINAEIIASSTAVPAIVPRVSSMAGDAHQIHRRLQNLLAATQPSSTSQAPTPVAQLAHLHSLHTQLASYQALLRLASSWSTLSTDISMLLAEATTPSATSADALANFTSASMRLCEARESLEVFGQSQEAREKEALLARLTATFLATLKPALANAVRSLEAHQDRASDLADDRSRAASSDTPSPVTAVTESIKTFADIFARVEQEETFGTVWRSTRRAAFVDRWTESIGGTQKTTSVSAAQTLRPLAGQLGPLLSDLVELVSAERLYVTVLFPTDALGMLALFIKEVLQSITPSLEQRIQLLTQDQSGRSLLEALQVTRVIRERGRQIEKILTRLASAGLPEKFENGVKRGRVSPNLKRRDSMVSPNRRGTGVLTDFSAQFYSFLLPFWLSYEAAEGTHLQLCYEKEIRTIDLPSPAVGESYLEHITHFISRSLTIINELSEDVLAHCFELTRSLTAGAAVRCIDTIASTTIKEISKDVEALCKNVWISLTSAQDSHGREWITFGKVTAFIAGHMHALKRASDLQANLVNELLPVAALLAALDGSQGVRATEIRRQTLTKLAALMPNADRAPAGWAPNAEELFLVTEQTNLLQDTWEQSVRETILKASKTNTANSLVSEPSGASLPFAKFGVDKGYSRRLPLPTSQLVLLPELTFALNCALAAPLHSLLVLPLVPVLGQLSRYASLAYWTSDTLPGQMSNEFHLLMPTFSLGPTEVMQAVGESLLGLVRDLEAYIEEPAVRWSLTLIKHRRRHMSGRANSELEAHDEYTDKASQDSGKQRIALDKKERRKSSMLPSETSLSLTWEKQQRRKSSFMPSLSPTAPRSETLAVAQGSIGGPGTMAPAGSAGHNVTPSSPAAQIASSPCPASPPITRAASDGQLGDASQGSEKSTRRNQTPYRADSSSIHSDNDEDLLPQYLSLLLTHLVTFHLMKRTLPALPQPPSQRIYSAAAAMTEAGWKQLNADIDYLDQILGALDRDPDGEDRDDEKFASASDSRLSNWHSVVGVGVEPGYEDGVDDFGYRAAFSHASNSFKETRCGLLPHQGSGASSIRQMLQAQRQSRSPRSSDEASGTSTPRVGGGRGGDDALGARSIVDLGAMNVGMRW